MYTKKVLWQVGMNNFAYNMSHGLKTKRPLDSDDSDDEEVDDTQPVTKRQKLMNSSNLI